MIAASFKAITAAGFKSESRQRHRVNPTAWNSCQLAAAVVLPLVRSNAILGKLQVTPCAKYICKQSGFLKSVFCICTVFGTIACQTSATRQSNLIDARAYKHVQSAFPSHLHAHNFGVDEGGSRLVFDVMAS